MPAFFIGNIFTLFAATSLHFALFLQPFCKFRNLRIIPRNFAKSRNNSNYAEILCDCNTENRRTVSRILAGIMQHAPGSRSNILPGSAPALHSIILYPFSPLPLPLRTTPSPSPRTLARNSQPAQDASAFAPKLARTLLFPAHSAAKQMAHHGTGFPPRRPVPGAVTGFGMQAGDTSPGHKKRALDGSKTLKKYYVMPP